MELQQLRYFVTVADLGNFTRAAEKCLVAQPSLSQQILKLEGELGRPLFDRLGRKVRLTDAGRTLYEHAVSILAKVDDAQRHVTESEESGVGRVNVGAIPTVAPYLLPPLLKTFLKRFPRAEVTVREDLTEHTIQSCLQGELDVGVLALPVDEEQLIVEPLFTEELLLATVADHPLIKKRRVNMADLSIEAFVLLSETHCLGEQIVSFCKQQSCLPAVSCHTAQLLTVQELVALGHGVSLIPEMAVAADRTKRRSYRSLSGIRPTRTLAMIRHKHRYQSPVVGEFVEMLRELGNRR
jgi:LysR family hydrogen peroxide-inducible transcriptional activator